MSDTIQSISKAIPDEEAGRLYLYVLDPSQPPSLPGAIGQLFITCHPVSRVKLIL